MCHNVQQTKVIFLGPKAGNGKWLALSITRQTAQIPGSDCTPLRNGSAPDSPHPSDQQ